jgi:hypothetical protein
MANTDANELVELAERGLDGDRRALAASGEITAPLAKVLLRKGDQDTLYELASNPATPGPTLRALSRAVRRGKLGRILPRPVPSAELARRLAANPSTPRSELLQRVRSGRWDVRAAALQNPSLAPSVVRTRIATEVWGVGALVAASTTDVDLLRMLLPSSERVRLAMATNPALPPDLLGALLDEDEPYVAAVVARHPNLTPELGDRLAAADAPAWVLRPASGNPSLAASQRDRLAARAAVARGNSAFDPLTCDTAPGELTGVSVEDWYEVASGADGARWSSLWRVRACLAARQTNAADAERFVVDPHPQVRLAALGATLSAAQLDELVHDADVAVGLRAVAVHDALPEDAKAPTSYGRASRRR